MSPVDSRLDALASGGTLVERGEFGLDAQKARQKLAQFQLPDPHAYVLELIQAAQLLGATRIEGRLDADELELCFDGAPLTRQELEQLYSAAFRRRVGQRERALRHLAIALTSAQAVRAGRAEISSGDGAAELALVIRHGPHQEPEESLVERASARTGTRIYLRERARGAHLKRFFQGVRGALPELQLLRERARHSTVPLSINGELITWPQGLKPPEPSEAAPFDAYADIEAPHVRGALGLSWDLKPGLEVRVGQRGVLVDTRHLDLGVTCGGVAIVEADHLSKNLSQSAFVEDEAWHELLHEVVLDAAWGALAQLMSLEALESAFGASQGGESGPGQARRERVRASGGSWEQQAEAFAGQIVALVCARRASARALGPGLVALAQRALALPLWRSADLVTWSPGDSPHERGLVHQDRLPLIAFGVSWMQPEQPLYVSAQAQSVKLPGHPQIMLKRGAQVREASEFLGQPSIVDVTSQLTSARQYHERGRALLRERPAQLPAPLASHGLLVAERALPDASAKVLVRLDPSLREQGARFALQLPLDRDGALLLPGEDQAPRLAQLSQARLVETRAKELLSSGFLVWFLGRLPMGPDMERPKLSEELYLELGLIALELMHELVLALAERELKRPSLEHRRWWGQLMVALSRRGAAQDTLRQLGVQFGPHATRFKAWSEQRQPSLMWCLGLHRQHEGHLAALGPLAQLPLLERVDGQALTLAQVSTWAPPLLALVAQERAKVDRQELAPLPEAQDVLWLHSAQVDLLRAALGFGVTRAEATLEVALARARYLAKPLWTPPSYEGQGLQRAQLEASGVALSLTLVEPVVGQRDARAQGVAVVDVIYLGRHMGAQEIPLPVGSFLGHVRCDELTAQPSWQSVLTDARWAAVARQAHEVAAQALVQWVEQVEQRAKRGELPLPPAQRWLMWMIMAASRDVAYSRAEAWRGVWFKLQPKLDALALFDLIELDEALAPTRQALTRVELVSRLEASQELVTAPPGYAELVRWAQPAPRTLLERPAQVASSHALLGAITGMEPRLKALEEIVDDRRRLEASERHFMLSPERELHPSKDSPWLRLEREAIWGFVSLERLGESPVWGLKQHLTVCHRRRAVEVASTDSPWLVLQVRAALEDAALIDWSVSSKPDPGRLAQARAMVEEAVKALIDQELQGLPSSPDLAAQTRWLERLCELLQRPSRQHCPQSRWLMARLMALPWLLVYGQQEPWSMQRALDAHTQAHQPLRWTYQRPEALEGLIFDADAVVLVAAHQRERALLERAFAGWPLEELRTQTPRDARFQPVRQVAYVKPTISAARPSATSSQASPQASPQPHQEPAAPAPRLAAPSLQDASSDSPHEASLPSASWASTPEARLVERLTHALLEARGPALTLFEDARLADTTIEALGPGSPLVQVHAQGAQINADHELVRLVLGSPQDDLATLMLAMSWFTALNVFEEPIEDEHERALLERMIQRQARSAGWRSHGGA